MVDPRRDYTIDDIKDALCRDLDGVLHKLGIDIKGRHPAQHYKIRSPLLGDRDKNASFIIYRKPPKWGAWVRFGGESGSILHLIERVGAARDQKEAVIWAKNYLGWTDLQADGLTAKEMEAKRADRERAAQREAQKAARKLKADRGRALHRWAQLPKSIEGTLAQVYLFNRGIDINLLRKLPGAIRFDPAHNYTWPFGEDMTCHPTVLSQVTGPDGTFYAVHRIFLKPDGSGKIDGAARKVWPSYSGGMIRLQSGASGLSPEDANRRVLGGDERHCRPVVITEGIEDGLAVAIAKPELRVWAAVSLGNYHNIVDMPCVSEWIVCRDNDWDKPQAVKSFEGAMARLRGFGKPVRIATPQIGKDANDVLRAGEIYGT